MNIVKKYLNYKPVQYLLYGILFAIIPLLDIYFSFLTRANISLLTRVMIFAIAALGFNILLGYSGQVSLGHAAFMGMGAYISANLMMKLNFPFLLAMLVSGIIPMLIGLLLGLVALRLARLYLAIATLGLAVTIQEIFKEWDWFTGGFSGIRGIPRASILGFELIKPQHYLILVTFILVFFAIFSYNFLNSKTGRALVAMRDSEEAAQAMGVSLFKYKLIAFSVSAFYVGVAGSLYAHFIRFLEPTYWDVVLSLDLLAMVVIGGLASIGGSIFGAAFIQMVPDIIRKIPLFQGIPNINFILTGVVLIVMIIYVPEGLSRKFSSSFHKVKNKVLQGIKRKSKDGKLGG
ncbi:branched-chain amino acid transport system permease protein [Anaerobranca californiensis DSM 14826]|jgi:branched-chain amino acid transport system permease protein|uniref:Branched-chain amino acid transport system permease protein n=1 Tax=Anaerobranca californiensis DSM 14826 TaxID=1120989 RepID=A0A1M6NTB6_9FIRM|nr:branched-chain amino acid ABC transporter permease [Anaerobranca californiensis]SHJ98885.1 branched-chain amino acid transport system permease protein [Anaerobranca californiensis DSM 14826]